MRLIVLTTRTKHHTFFLQKVYEQFEIHQIVYENKGLVSPYGHDREFDALEDQYEERFFEPENGGCNRELPKELEKRSIDVYSVNQNGVKEYLESYQPDVIWVYGAGKIYPHIIEVPSWGMVNLHGGISQKYRGLDSAYWAMYNNDFKSLGLTVHYVEPELDTGNILSQNEMLIGKEDELWQFRYKMTQLATQTSLELLSDFMDKAGMIPAEPQAPGKYYSFIPPEKKQAAARNLSIHKKAL